LIANVLPSAMRFALNTVPVDPCPSFWVRVNPSTVSGVILSWRMLSDVMCRSPRVASKNTGPAGAGEAEPAASFRFSFLFRPGAAGEQAAGVVEAEEPCEASPAEGGLEEGLRVFLGQPDGEL